MDGFGKDFSKIKTGYVRAQTGALYNKIVSERAAGRFDVDVIQHSAFRFAHAGVVRARAPYFVNRNHVPPCAFQPCATTPSLVPCPFSPCACARVVPCRVKPRRWREPVMPRAASSTSSSVSSRSPPPSARARGRRAALTYSSRCCRDRSGRCCWRCSLPALSVLPAGGSSRRSPRWTASAAIARACCAAPSTAPTPLFYLALAAWAGTIAVGWTRHGGGERDVHHSTAWLMKLPFGRLLVALVGIGVAATGFAIAARGIRPHVARQLTLAPRRERIAEPWFRFGEFARAVVFVLIGLFVLTAAIEHRVAAAKGWPAHCTHCSSNRTDGRRWVSSRWASSPSDSFNWSKRRSGGTPGRQYSAAYGACPNLSSRGRQ
jgi:hypothetical protein